MTITLTGVFYIRAALPHSVQPLESNAPWCTQHITLSITLDLMRSACFDAAALPVSCVCGLRWRAGRAFASCQKMRPWVPVPCWCRRSSPPVTSTSLLQQWAFRPQNETWTRTASARIPSHHLLVNLYEAVSGVLRLDLELLTIATTLSAA